VLVEFKQREQQVETPDAKKFKTAPTASSNQLKSISGKEGLSKSNKVHIYQDSGRLRFNNREKGLTMKVPDNDSNHEIELLLGSKAMCQNKLIASKL
jgi:type II restriction/modification system DNA methylase subunit YeeA